MTAIIIDFRCQDTGSRDVGCRDVGRRDVGYCNAVNNRNIISSI